MALRLYWKKIVSCGLWGADCFRYTRIASSIASN